MVIACVLVFGGTAEPATPPSAAAQAQCDAACMLDLTRAIAAFGVGKAARVHDAHHPRRTVLDTWPQERVPSAQRGRTMAALRAIGQDLGIPVTNRNTDPGWARCVEDPTSPGCRAERGRTFIDLSSLRIPEPGYAVVRVSITVLDGEGGFHSNSSDVLMMIVDGEWRAIAEDIFIVS